MALTGLIRSSNRQDLLTNATKLATKYYGHDCVNVHITNEQSTTQFAPMPFQANYEATEHDWEIMGNHCLNCGKERR